MKKIIAVCLALVVVLSVVGCSKTDSYSVTIKDNFPIVNELKSTYQAGEEVTIQLATVTEQYYVLYVNGEEQQQTNMDMLYTYFTFAMPSEDVTIVIDIVGVDIPYPPQTDNNDDPSQGGTQPGDTQPSGGTQGDRPTQPSNPYNSLLAYASSKIESMITESLNFDKIAISSVQHLPIFKCESLGDLEGFKSPFGSSGYNEVPSFTEVSKGFGEDFFKDNTLLLVYVAADSGSYRFGLDRFSIADGTFCADIIQTNSPEDVTDDLASWMIIIPVSRDQLQGVTSYDAVMK